MKAAIAVTGASRGIGSAIARTLAARGYEVACLSRAGRGVEDAAVDDAVAVRLHPYGCDVTDEASVRDALAAAAAELGGIGGLVNNAGIHRDGASTAFSAESFRAVLDTNAVSAFVASREAHPHLVANGGGLIVNLGSYYDRLGIPRNTAYCASKAAIGAITRCLAVEWGGDGIRVMDVAPGFIETDLNRSFMAKEKFRRHIEARVPVGRAGTAAEIGRVVASLFTDDVGYLTGATIYVDGAHGIRV